MALLEQIIDGASGEASISSLLRQLRVLASRTGGATLDAWVSSELNGYGPDEPLPPYRGPFRLAAFGHFLGSFGAQMKDAQIPPSTFPEELRSVSFDQFLRNGIAEIEEMSKSPITVLGWPADFVQLYNEGLASGLIQPFLRRDFVCVQVKTPLPSHILIGILDAVRSRALDIALHLEREAPAAGQLSASTEERARAITIINNHITGPANVAIGSPGSTLTVTPPARGDTDALIAYLMASGFGPERLRPLEEAIEEDQVNGSANTGRWERVRGWFGSAITDVGTGTASSVLSTAATTFLGGL
ncbi:hypothetical protein [Cellulomonas cellasea]|uniref:AbiTii domain-containing protein n=1 Tax=Cellulomonas cellasea TaxID=43670 RepID=A0A7W4UBU3_9CELL|nr:hypothetical protein [Cellulomonas cellasea]MBB2921313.1 hypothetical protein [Cellulomonas cellasea]